MDVISHGLWGGIAFGRKNRYEYLAAFLIGIAPDVLSFGLLIVANLLGLVARPDWSNGPPDPAMIPEFVHMMYNVTHSLVIFAFVFGFAWLFRKRPLWVLGAWGLHILVDIPSHSEDFFPTPFLWPVSDFTFNGINWGDPVIYFPNVAILLILYTWFFINMYISKNKRYEKS